MSESGSPNRSIHRTFRAVFEMPTIPSNCNLIKTGKRQYRNPIYVAKEWRRALDSGEYPSLATLARHLKVSRSRVTQIMNLLKLSPDVLEMISALGDPLTSPIAAERSLRILLGLSFKEQKARITSILSRRY